MDGVEEEGRGSQGKRNLDVRGRGEDSHGDGEPLLERGFYHTNDYALLPRHCYFWRQLLLVQRELPRHCLSAFFYSLFILSLSFFVFFPFPAPFPPFPVFFYSFLDCRRAKLGYYRRHYLPSFPLSSNFVQCLLSTRSFPVSFSFARSFRSFSSFPFFFLSSCFSFLRCSGRREGREYYLFGLCVFVGESTETAVFFS